MKNIELNLFQKRDGKWAVRIECGENESVITDGFYTPKEALLVSNVYCEEHGYYGRD